MKIMDELQTIQWLIDNRGSISRYGDGELKICTGRAAKSQPGGLEIQIRLCDILKKPLPGHLVGIPRNLDRNDWPTKEKGIFWAKYATERYLDLYDPKIQYGSAFITRPDTNSALNTVEYYELIKALWKDRSVLVCHGEGRGFLKRPCLLDTARDHKVVIAPAYDAFADYQSLLSNLLSASNENTVVLLSLGPTATVLAYDLHKAGRQALDLGHLGMFYAHVHPKSTGPNHG